MTILHIDFEVFSECDLTSAGVYRYAEHPSTEIMACSYAFDDGPVILWIPYDNVPQEIFDDVKARRPEARILVKFTCPKDVANHISDARS